MSTMPIRFKLISRKQRGQFDIILQELFDDLSIKISQLSNTLSANNVIGTKKYFGDADFSLEVVDRMPGERMFVLADDEPKDCLALKLEDISAYWWAHLETGHNFRGNKYLIIYAAQGKAPKNYTWKKLYDKAMIGGKADICLDATLHSSDNQWDDNMPFIDFSHPLASTLRNAMLELGLMTEQEFLKE